MTCQLLCTTEDRQSWLAARKQGIGASEIASVLGVSPYESALALWARKTGRVIKEENDENELMFWGKQLEDKIAKVTCDKAGAAISQLSPGVFAHADHQWMLASPDGIIHMPDAPEIPLCLEVKNINVFAAKRWQNIPEHFQLQCQQQMLVMDAPRDLWGGLIGGNWHVWDWIDRDEKECDRIVRAGAEFWKMVQEDVPPPSDGSDSAHEVAMMLAVQEQMVELFDSEVGDILREREECELARKELEKEVKALKNRATQIADNLLLKMGGKTSAFTTTGWSISVGTVNRKGYSVEPSSYRTVKIKAPK
jgi:putative phage-type endonuclease